MSKGKPFNEIVGRDAAEWYVRLREGDMSREERFRYVRWLKSAPAHVLEILELHRIHCLLTRAKLQQLTPIDPLYNVITLPLEQTESAADSEREEGLGGSKCQRDEPMPVQRSPRRTGRIAAIVAGVGFAGLLFASVIKGLLPDSTLTTGAGEWQKKLLQDGSIVHLGPNTELRLDWAEQQRSIRLVRGEALFDVARERRPFVVITDVGSVRAVGTQFAVSWADGTALVTVSEGKVAVSGKLTASPTIPLTADQQIALSSKGAEPIRKVNAARELQWASGWIDIGGRTVGEVAHELNRRNRMQIIVSDPVVAALVVPAIPLELDAPEAFVSMVSDRRDIAAIRDSAGNVHLQRG